MARLCTAYPTCHGGVICKSSESKLEAKAPRFLFQRDLRALALIFAKSFWKWQCRTLQAKSIIVKVYTSENRLSVHFHDDEFCLKGPALLFQSDIHFDFREYLCSKWNLHQPNDMLQQASRTTKWKLHSTYELEECVSVLVRSTPKLDICTASILVPVDKTGEHETRIASDFEPYQACRSLSSYCARLQTAHNASDDKSGQSDTLSDNSSPGISRTQAEIW